MTFVCSETAFYCDSFYIGAKKKSLSFTNCIYMYDERLHTIIIIPTNAERKRFICQLKCMGCSISEKQCFEYKKLIFLIFSLFKGAVRQIMLYILLVDKLLGPLMNVKYVGYRMYFVVTTSVPFNNRNTVLTAVTEFILKIYTGAMIY